MILTGQAGEVRFEIRPVDQEREVDAILEVYRQCEDFLALGPVSAASLPMVQEDLHHSQELGGVFYGIYDLDCGVMMGIVDYVTDGFLGDDGLAFLSLLMIAAPFRSRGLGAEVVQLVEGDMRRTGQARAVESGVQVNNPQAVRFWQRMGYRIISDATDMADGTTVFRLWKDL
jgi:ribosomal protein S18 acetylase RimI-like enzyme